MWFFAGCLFVGAVLWYWLRRVARILDAVGVVFEATINRTLSKRGEPPIVSDEDARERWG